MCNVNCIRWGARNLSYEEIKGRKVIEVGSYDVNGSLRYIVELLQPEEYVGVDIVEGLGVDIICPVENLVEKFGEESFDIVISTCLLEHIRDWRRAVSNIKNVCKTNGIIMIIVPSVMPYHSYPNDFWRFSKEDMANIFRDCEILAIEEDSQPLSNVYCKAIKPNEFIEEDLSEHALYSIVVNKRIIEIEDSDLQGIHFRLLLFGQKVRLLKKKIDSFLLKLFMRCLNPSPKQ